MILPGLQSISVFCGHCEVLPTVIKVGLFVAVPGWPPGFEVELVRTEVQSPDRYRVRLPLPSELQGLPDSARVGKSEEIIAANVELQRIFDGPSTVQDSQQH